MFLITELLIFYHLTVELFIFNLDRGMRGKLKVSILKTDLNTELVDRNLRFCQKCTSPLRVSKPAHFKHTSAERTQRVIFFYSANTSTATLMESLK
jgi:hypothetical protein